MGIRQYLAKEWNLWIGDACKELFWGFVLLVAFCILLSMYEASRKLLDTEFVEPLALVSGR